MTLVSHFVLALHFLGIFFFDKLKSVSKQVMKYLLIGSHSPHHLKMCFLSDHLPVFSYLELLCMKSGATERTSIS
jgi:hypothetical protein